ncbi:hypothetical protein BS47DRAFT_1365106 [Hydnum rufescens UP504]|uniref:Carboxylesterase type B domain-containing protein n=1 Tax=Hydnum rufescens UP504 TaxID=1448309 RepID=A0A9P6API8_9AGAM|nr:hypothetical protein BS47DRAFT_1365106 [Hydnum rufescens UP504]
MFPLTLIWLATYTWAFPFCPEETTVHSPSVSGFRHHSESYSSCPNDLFDRVKTPIGYARGIQSSPGVIRFAVRYATSSRWQEALPVTTWSIPNDDPEALPPWCPQSGPPASHYSEDCLFLVLYVPVQAAAYRKLNTLVWVHGGSFIEGSATGAGLDGSSFALASGSIVVTVQYRLGVLGFLPPPSLDQNVNLGVKDITTALEFLHRVLPSFGGDPGEITMAGQSSGAMMLRVRQQGTLSPMRPMVDGSFITTSLTGTSFPSALKPVIITTVENEAGQAIGSIFPSPLPIANFEPIVEGSFGQNRTQTLLSSSCYEPQAMHIDAMTGNDQTRMALELLGTDSNWRCSSWTFARTYAVKGGNVHVGVFQLGATYPSNANVEYCSIAGRVCHGGRYLHHYYFLRNLLKRETFLDGQFGTTPSPTSAESCVTREIQARWSAFMHTSDPNPFGSSYATWMPVEKSGNVHALQFGLSGGEAPDRWLLSHVLGRQGSV